MTRASTPRMAPRRLSRLRPRHVPQAGRKAVRGWRNYRERQLTLLAESNRLQREILETRPPSGRAAGAPTPDAGVASTGAAPAQTAGKRHVSEQGPGAHLALRSDAHPDPPVEPTPAARPGLGLGLGGVSPFYIGFSLALGGLLAWVLVQNLTRLTSIFTFMLVALFVTLALEPVVRWLTRRGMARAGAVFLVFLGLITVITLIGLLVVPPIVSQGTLLVERIPRYLQNLSSAPWFNELDERFDLTTRMSEEADRLATDSGTISTVFGGVLGAAGWVAGSVVGLFTSVILTLYLLATLPAAKEAAYRLIPQSRRPRIAHLAEEIMNRVGGYALGQSVVATINALCSWVVMQILGIPYAAVLAVLVGLLGLIPMVGATLGALIVAGVGLTVSLTTAVIVVVYYFIYQQLENYVIVPNIMRRTVSVPGAVTVVAVLAGGTLLGVLGALIAIPVAAGLLLIYHEVLVPRQNAR